jgi:hypothetical protein
LIRGEVLAAGGDHDVLLAPEDAHVAVRVDGAEVARVHPAVGVERLARQLRLTAVAGERIRPADQQLAIVGHAQLDVREVLADRAGPGPAGRARRRRDRLGHAPHVADGQPDRREQLEHLG